MEPKTINSTMLAQFEAYLRRDEKSEATIEKYLRDVRRFAEYAGEQEVTKALTLQYKATLEESYAVTSANSMLAAMNAFLRFMGWLECCVKQYKTQWQAYCPEEKELTKDEYFRLIQAAKDQGKERLQLIIQTICGTGIRVSELRYITVEAVRRGEAVVNCKRKKRMIFIVPKLRKKLLQYTARHGITKGACFVTRTGKEISRNNIWREMKMLCCQANVDPAKVFPHNLRHLFARTFYGLEKDIAKLADILGHSSINTTRIYIITTGAEHKKKMESMQLIL